MIQKKCNDFKKEIRDLGVAVCARVRVPVCARVYALTEMHTHTCIDRICGSTRIFWPANIINKETRHGVRVSHLQFWACCFSFSLLGRFSCSASVDTCLTVVTNRCLTLPKASPPSKAPLLPFQSFLLFLNGEPTKQERTMWAEGISAFPSEVFSKSHWLEASLSMSLFMHAIKVAFDLGNSFPFLPFPKGTGSFLAF